MLVFATRTSFEDNIETAAIVTKDDEKVHGFGVCLELFKYLIYCNCTWCWDDQIIDAANWLCCEIIGWYQYTVTMAVQ